MSAEGLRRPLILSLAAVATVATTYLIYRSYATSEEDASQRLQRRNAVRRPRRQRAEPNLQGARSHTRRAEGVPVESDEERPRRSTHIQNTLNNLQNSAQPNDPSGGIVLGRYRNETLLPVSGSDNVPFSTQFGNPRLLEELVRNILATAPTLSESQQRSLRQHVQVSYVRAALQSLFSQGAPPGAAEREELITALSAVGLDRDLVSMTIEGARAEGTPFDEAWTFETTPYESGQLGMFAQRDDPSRFDPPSNPLPVVDGHISDISSVDSPLFEIEDEGTGEQGHNMLNLLYHIAEEQAKKNGYVHRGVECNSCAACPIQGVRYHCANCFDYDLCETCESKGVHYKTHVFYKIRIPAPPRGQIKQVIPKWYPGNPGAFPSKIPRALEDRLKEETGLDNPELQGLYEQYKCIAGHRHPSDPAELGMAMDRKAFDMYFIPLPSDRPTPANLIYDRIFTFYDANDDGLIDFVEFVHGVTKLNDKSFMAKLRRLFQAFDLDGDGYVSRKDFLRMLRAHYDLTTQLNREMIARNEDIDIHDEMRETVHGTQPISSVFGGSLPHGHLSRQGLDKELVANGDLEIINGPNGVLQEDLEMTADRHRVIGDVATGSRARHHPFRSFRPEPPRDEQMIGFHTSNVEVLAIQHADDASEAELTGPDPPFHTYGWPPLLTPEPQDIISSLHADIPIEEITDPIDRSRVVYAQSQRLDAESDNLDAHKRKMAINERWKRRQFYLDEEEGMKRPAGYVEPDSSDSDDSDVEEIDSPRRHRSRSSSKVRFDDSAIDTDYETRSNASSRSGAPNERWGGYELSRPTVDVGADILYAAVQQGFNELLNPLFKAKEDQALEAIATRPQRTSWKTELDEYAKNVRAEEANLNEALLQADKLRTDELLQQAQPEATPNSSRLRHQGIAEGFQVNFDGSGNNISPEARRAAGEIQAQINEALNNVNAASALSRDVTPDPPRASSSAHRSSSGVPPATTAAVEVGDLLERDPTLPQFRPDDEDDASHAASVDKDHKSKTIARSSNSKRQQPPPAVPSPPSADPDANNDDSDDLPPPSPPLKSTLARWLRHRRVDEEAKSRGGHGRLNFLEFRLLIEAANVKDREGRGGGRESGLTADDYDNEDGFVPGPGEGEGDGGSAAARERPMGRRGRDQRERRVRTPEEIVSIGINRAGQLDSRGASGDVDEEDDDAGDEDAAYWERNAGLGKLAFLSTWLDMAGF
jgi:Ca2+-binding EF-hand superfamily protein